MSFLPILKLYPCFREGRWQQCLLTRGLWAAAGAFWRSVIQNIPIESLPTCTWLASNCLQSVVGTGEAGG